METRVRIDRREPAVESGAEEGRVAMPITLGDAGLSVQKFLDCLEITHGSGPKQTRHDWMVIIVRSKPGIEV
jgi:hypothetical protein